MPEQTADPTAGLPLYHKLGRALNEPAAVVPRERVFGRGGGREPDWDKLGSLADAEMPAIGGAP